MTIAVTRSSASAALQPTSAALHTPADHEPSGSRTRTTDDRARPTSPRAIRTLARRGVSPTPGTSNRNVRMPQRHQALRQLDIQPERTGTRQQAGAGQHQRRRIGGQRSAAEHAHQPPLRARTARCGPWLSATSSNARPSSSASTLQARGDKQSRIHPHTTAQRWRVRRQVEDPLQREFQLRGRWRSAGRSTAQ